MMTLFDGPDTLQDLPCRAATTVAPQALLLMNNALVRDSATAMSNRLAGLAHDDESFVEHAFRLAVARPPSDDERRAGRAFLAEQAGSYQQDGRENAANLARIDFCQALLCLNEFVYVE
jgi:hypothetical protein